jgi:hypothetical protein
MARNSAKNSAKFARELSIRAVTECLYCTTASENLVVDRTHKEVVQNRWHLTEIPMSRVQATRYAFAVLSGGSNCQLQFGTP